MLGSIACAWTNRRRRFETLFECLEDRRLLSSPTGADLLLNEFPAEVQSTAGTRSVASRGDGMFVAVWESFNQDALLTWGIRGRRFHANGSPNGAEFLVNTAYVLSDQRRPQIAMNTSGTFVVAWEGVGLLGLFPGIYAQRYAADGTPVGATIGVAGSILLSVSDVSVGIDDGGNFVIAYESTDATLSRGIFARRYASDGTSIGSEFLVNGTTSGTQEAPAVAMHADGAFAIAWNGGGSGDAAGVFARFYSASGAPLGGETRLNSTGAGVQEGASLASLINGGYQAAWQGNGTGDASGVFTRAISNGGTPLGAEQRVNQTTSGTQQEPSVVSDLDGDFVVTWSGEGTGDGSGVFVREFDQSGSPRSAEVQVNVTTAGNQAQPSISNRGDNGYVVQWAGSAPADSDGVYARLLVNSVPVITGTAGSVTYIENGLPIAVDSSLTLADSDHTLLTGAAVTIAVNFAVGEDTLFFTDQLGITGHWNATTATMTLAGVASLADYQAALRSVAYHNGNDNPSTLQRSITFTVNDGVDNSASPSRSLDVLPVNDAPVVATSAGTETFIENDFPVAIDPGLAIGDLDSLTLASAAIQISANFAASEDSLGYTNQSGITGSWDAVTGTFTLNGTASIAAYQAALRSVTYFNSSDDPSVALRTVSFFVNDGTDASNMATRFLAVTAVNDPSVVTASVGSASYVENASGVAIDPGVTVADIDSTTFASATIQITGNFVSGEDTLFFADQLGITGSWNTITGVLSLSGVASVVNYRDALRSITYFNASDDPSTLTRTVTFSVNDGVDASNMATRSVTVTAVNDPSVVTASAGSASYVENASGVAIDPGIAVTDTDSTIFASATIQITGNFVSGEDELFFTDQLGITGSWNAITGVLSLSGVASVVNYRDALRSITYLNASDNPSTLPRTITFSVNDGVDASNMATRSVTVTAVNDAPVLTTSSGSASYTENDAGVTIDAGIVIADHDSANLWSATVQLSSNYFPGEDLLSFANQSGISGAWDSSTGTLTLSGIASVAAYQAALRTIAYFNSSDDPSTMLRGIGIYVNDGTDASNNGLRLLTVTSVNDLPILTNGSGTAIYIENGTGTLVDDGLTISDLDSFTLSSAIVRIIGNFASDQDSLQFTNQSGITASWDPATGALTLSGVASVVAYQAAMRSIMYINSSDSPSTAVRTIGYSVNDGIDTSNSGARSLTVDAVNDSPVLIASSGSAAYSENDASVQLDPAITASDVDHALLAGATITVTSNYVFGEDALLFTDQLGITGSWNAATGTLTLSGIAPVLAYQTALRSISYLNLSDNPSTLLRIIRFSVDDGADTSNAAFKPLAITEVNDPSSVITSGGSAAYVENHAGIPVDGGVTLTDVDSVILSSAVVRISGNFAFDQDSLAFTDQHGITGSWAGTTGTLTLSGLASVAHYQAALCSVMYLNASDNPSTLVRTLSFSVYDGSDTSDIATRSLTVTTINDPPAATSSGGVVGYTENHPAVLIDAGITLADIDSATLSYATVQIVSNFVSGEDALFFTSQSAIVGAWDAVSGTLTLSGTASVADYQTALRSITYSNASDNPSTSLLTISFVVTDDTDSSAAAFQTVVVVASNDRSIVLTSAGSTDFIENGAPAAIDPSLTLADVDSSTLNSATVRFTANYFSDQDVLTFIDQYGIAGLWDGVTGTLTLSGTAPLATYQMALRSVTYRNSSDNPDVLSRTVVFTVHDSTDESWPSSRDIQIAAVNDTPVVAANAGATTYVENSVDVLIDLGLTLIDVDSIDLLSATVQITGNFLSDQDSLGFTNQGGIAGSWDAATGTLTLIGAAPIAAYEAALRSITYFNSSESPATSLRTIALRVSDGLEWSNNSMRSLAVTAINDAPAVSIGNGNVLYAEDDLPLAVGSGLTLIDPDSMFVVGATVTIAVHYTIGEDTLMFADQFGITGSWNPTTATLTLLGNATVAQYETALRSVTYRNSSDDPSTLQRAITFAVNDGVDSSHVGLAVDIEGRDDPLMLLFDQPLLSVQIATPTSLFNSTLYVFDRDNTPVERLEVRIVSGFEDGDSLFISSSAYLTHFDPATGVLTLDGSFRPSDLQAILAQLFFQAENLGIASRVFQIVTFSETEQSQVVLPVTVFEPPSAPVEPTPNDDSPNIDPPTVNSPPAQDEPPAQPTTSTDEDDVRSPSASGEAETPSDVRAPEPPTSSDSPAPGTSDDNQPLSPWELPSQQPVLPIGPFPGNEPLDQALPGTVLNTTDDEGPTVPDFPSQSAAVDTQHAEASKLAAISEPQSSLPLVPVQAVPPGMVQLLIAARTAVPVEYWWSEMSPLQRSVVVLLISGAGSAVAAYAVWGVVVFYVTRRAASRLDQVWLVDLTEYLRYAEQHGGQRHLFARGLA